MSSSISALTGGGPTDLTGGIGSSLVPSQGTTIGALQGASSVLGGLSSLAAGDARASSYGIQAGEWRTQAGDEMVMGQNQVTGLKSQYLNQIGALSGRMAAGGVDVGQGVGAANRTEIGQAASTAEQSTMLASDIRKRRDMINAILADAAASQAQAAGEAGLFMGILQGGVGLLSAGIL